ncbi:MAG: CBS domain-containing protein [SAR324 cluster bacterium]|nr:CBS domain-containing protein [SAR324 cluster bacterium]
MLKVKDLMTTELFTLKENDNLNISKFLMENKKIRHMPVINHRHEFIGLITQRDLLAMNISTLADLDEEQEADILKGIPVVEVMREEIATVTPDTDLQDAAKLMFDHKYGCLPVLDGKKLLGIITEADFVRLTWKLLQYAKERQDEQND